MQDARTLGHGVKYWDAARAVSELSKVKWESKKFLGAMLDLASYAPEFVAQPEMFDADPYLLGTPAGTVDLRLGKVLEPEREHYLTRQTSVSPERGPHPLFDDVIRRASGGEEDIAAYLWNWLGYLLTGLTKEKAFLYLFGKTDSGKTTLASALANILGNSDSGGYAAQCDVEMFTETKMDKGNDRLAHLSGARFAYASEMEEGRNFKTALLKLATGSDAMKGRYLYAEEFSFQATHKLWIFGNHKMHMKSSDSALLNRLHMLEYKDAFIVSPEERDNDFQEKLRAEYPAILHSMILACVRYLDGGGLGRPEAISQAVEDYANNEDTLGQFIAECLDLSTDARTPAAETYQCFSKWAEREGAYVPSAKRFGQQLEDRGFGRARPGGVRSFVGFSIKVGANL
jgi:putative DNA primase/helicase